MTEKYCSKCEQDLPLAEFGKNRNSPDGLYCQCLECCNTASKARYAADPTKTKASAARRRLADPTAYRHKCRKDNLRKKYGITVADFEQMLKAQHGKCAICRGTSTNGKRLSVDHNHDTGKIRGLLCFRCNTAIGNLQDSAQICKDATAYLENDGYVDAGTSRITRWVPSGCWSVKSSSSRWVGGNDGFGASGYAPA